MKQSTYWLIGVLAILAALGAVVVVQQRVSGPPVDRASLPTPQAAASPSPSPEDAASPSVPSPVPTPIVVGATPPGRHHRGGGHSPTPVPAPEATPLVAQSSASPSASLLASPATKSGRKSYVCPTCGNVVEYDSALVGTRMLRCWNCATVFYADDSMTPLDPAHVPQPSATPTASAGASPADPLAAVDAALQKMDWGQLAFDVPERLRKDQTALIHLLVSPTATVEQLTATIREQATEPVRIEPARVQITDLMEAKLVGSAFDIQPVTPEEPQMISRSQPTEWKWEIRPRQTGRQSLHLTLNAIVRYNDEKHSRAVKTFDRVIEVEVAAAPSFFERARSWFFAVVGLVALVNTVLIFLRRKRRPGKSPPVAFVPPDSRKDRDGHDLFVSYSRRDQEQALAFVGRLQAVGYQVWIDQRGIEGAALWAQEISEAIRRSKACVLFASAAAFGSANVTREVSLVCEEGKPILPLLLEPAEVPSALRFQLAGIQHIELFRGEAEENFQKVLRALERLGVARPIAAGGR